MNFGSHILRKYSNPKVVKSFEIDNDLFYSLCGFFSITFNLCEACFLPPRLDRKLSACQKVLKCQNCLWTRVSFSFRWDYRRLASLESGFSIISDWGGQIYHCLLRHLDVLLSNLWKVEDTIWLDEEQLNSAM